MTANLRRLCATAAFALLLTACGSKEAPAPAANAPAAAPVPGVPTDAEKVLNVYNWSDYIEENVVPGFEKEYGIKVNYDVFDSNEVLETKVLTGGTGYDLVVPSNHNVPRYIAAGAIQPLDKAKLPNLKNLSGPLRAYMAPFDPGAKYAVPYMWGTIGIGYNRDAIAKRLPGVNIDSWADVLEPQNLAKLKDCGVYFLDASEDMFAVTMDYMGLDPNSKSIADYQKAEVKLAAARPYVRKFHSSEYIDALANGDICIAIGYSGDVLQAKTRADQAGKGVHIAYAIPKEGSQVWFDVFTMPKDAPDPEQAYAFLNYMLEPKVIAKASDYTHYANANGPARVLVDPAIRDDPNVYPPPAVFRRLFVTTTKDQALLRQVNRLWTQVRTGQ